MAGSSAKTVDFSNVKDGGSFNRKRIPAGDYLATITKVEDAEAKDGTFQYLVSIKLTNHSTSVFPYYCKLQENQLWKLRNLLIAAGLTVPKKKIKVDPNRLVNKQIGVTIEDDEYEGKEQSNIAGVFPAAELADGHDDTEDEPVEDDDDDAEDTLDDEPEEDEEEPDEEDEDEAANAAEEAYADFDRAALKAELKKRDGSFVAKKSQTDDDLRKLLLEQDAAGGDDEDEEEEPAPKPKPKAKAAAKPRAKAKAKASEVSDDELDELDIDDI